MGRCNDMEIHGVFCKCNQDVTINAGEEEREHSDLNNQEVEPHS